jgi:fido (protein-threonine AMPylation protein)
MEGDPVELKSQKQFFLLDKGVERWRQRRLEEAVSRRFRHLTEEIWSRENQALEEFSEGPSPAARKSNRLKVGKLRQSNHIRTVRWWLERTGQPLPLTTFDLLELHQLLWNGLIIDAGKFRSASDPPSEDADAREERSLLSLLIGEAMTWFASPSFTQIHPVEQTALILIRLVDLSPFSGGNDTTARIFSNYGLLHGGYPPFVVSAAKAPQYMAARKEAAQFSTQKMVDLIAASVGMSLGFCLGETAIIDPFPVLHDLP